MKIIVHRDDDLVSCLADAAKQRVMLTVIARQVNSAHLRICLGQRRDDFSAFVGTAVIDKEQLEGRDARLQDGANTAEGHQPYRALTRRSR